MFFVQISILLLFLINPLSLANSKNGKIGTYPNEFIQIKGQKRFFRLVVSKGLSKLAPLVFAFHGF